MEPKSQKINRGDRKDKKTLMIDTGNLKEIKNSLVIKKGKGNLQDF